MDDNQNENNSPIDQNINNTYTNDDQNKTNMPMSDNLNQNNVPIGTDQNEAYMFLDSNHGKVNVSMDNNQKRSPRSYYIIFGVLVSLVAILGVVGICLALKPQNEPNNTNVGSETTVSDDDNNTVSGENKKTQYQKDYMSLTKEEALVAYKEMQKSDYVPDGYISEDVIPPNECEPMNGLLYSYKKYSEIEEIYKNSMLTVMSALQEIKNVQDYYIVAFSAPFDYSAVWSGSGVASGCLRMFSFNGEYYDYSADNYTGVFIDTSADFIELALPVLATSSGEMAKLNAIYSYDFEEDEDGSISLNIHSIGLGDDSDYSDSAGYKQEGKVDATSQTALQFYTQKYRYDASTKQADWVRECDGCILGMKIGRSIPLSSSEVNSLLNTK